MKIKQRPSTILVKGGNRVVIDYANRVISRYLRGDFSVMRFDAFKRLTPEMIAAWYRRLGYVPETRRAHTNGVLTCCAPNCTQPRYETTKGGKTFLDKRCREHALEHRRQTRKRAA